MANKGYKPEQIINKLREAEVLLSRENSIVEASRKIGVTEQTYYRWRKEYGGMWVEPARMLKELEKENARLKKLVADLSLDNEILKESSKGTFQARRGGAERWRRYEYDHIRPHSLLGCRLPAPET